MIAPHQGFTGSDIPPDDVFNACVRCGLCLPTCPTYVETLVETSSPRGRIALIKAVAEERLDLTSPGFVHQMSECLDCRACEAVCPSGVEYGRILEPARTQVVRATAEARPWHVRLLRAVVIDRLFSHLWIMRVVAFFLRFYQRSGLRALVRKSGILRAFGLASMEAMAPEISARFFVAQDQRWPARGPRKATAFMHAGCVMHVAFAETDRATVRVLQRSGVEVIAPRAQGCCGAIAVHAGDMELGRRMAIRNIVAFERSDADVYVINAAGCGSALKEYGNLFGDVPEWHARALAFSAKVRDITEYLDEIGIADDLGALPMTATYQEPCHLVHAQRIAAAPRRLLDRIPGLTLVEMAESSLCCGSAGIYNLVMPEMAQRLQARKVANVVATAADVCATANPGCQLQVQAGLAADGRTTPVRHIVDLLDASYAAYDASRGAA